MTLFVSLRLAVPALETAVESAPGVDVTVEQRTMTADGALDLTAWAAGGDVGGFEEGLDADDTVARWLPIGRTDARKLYRIRLTERASSRVDVDGWTDGRAVPLWSERTRRGWRVNAFVGDRSVLREFATGCESSGVTFDLARASEVDRLTGPPFALTELQAETLLTAFERGFYSVPRRNNLDELAAQLGVSHQALSERLRRGVGSLIETTIAPRYDGAPRGDAGERSQVSVADGDLVLERPIALDP